jgi:hypothetical protein
MPLPNELANRSLRPASCNSGEHNATKNPTTIVSTNMLTTVVFLILFYPFICGIPSGDLQLCRSFQFLL